jgi:hypothetical protein
VIELLIPDFQCSSLCYQYHSLVWFYWHYVRSKTLSVKLAQLSVIASLEDVFERLLIVSVAYHWAAVVN